MSPRDYIIAVVVTWLILALIAQLEKKWVPIFPGSGEEPADHKEVPVPYEDEEQE